MSDIQLPNNDNKRLIENSPVQAMIVESVPVPQVEGENDDDGIHATCANLPIVGSDKPCLLSEQDKKWFGHRELHLDDESGEVCFFEHRRNKLKKYLVSECVLAMATCDGRKPQHPLGLKGLTLYIKIKTPADIKRYCFRHLSV